MESSKNLFWNKAMFWGFVTALILMITTTIFYATDNMFSPSKGWIEYVIYIAGIAVCAIAFKKAVKENEPFPYSRALGLGVATMLFTSVIMAVFNFVLFKFIDNTLIDQTLKFTEEKLLEAGVNDNMIEQQMEMMRKVYTPALLSLGTLFGGVIMGLIFSLITSIFLRKKEEDGFKSAMNEIDDEE